MDILLLRSARRRDAIDHAVMIGFAGIDPRRSEGGLVGRVGKFLGFQRDAVAHAVEMAVLADERAVEEVAGIDLHPRLSGPQLEHASRFRVLQPGGEFGLAGDALVEHEIMVMSRSEEHTSELQSLMRISYAVFCLKKKKRRNNKTTNKRDT